MPPLTKETVQAEVEARLKRTLTADEELCIIHATEAYNSDRTGLQEIRESFRLNTMSTFMAGNLQLTELLQVTHATCEDLLQKVIDSTH